MKAIRSFFTRYFNSSILSGSLYLASVLFLNVLAIISLSTKDFSQVTDILGYVMILLVLLSFFGILSVITWNLIKKRWRLVLFNTLTFILVSIIGVVVTSVVFMGAMFGPSEDGFADTLALPKGIEISEPLENMDEKPGINDAFQQALLLTINSKGDNGDTTVTANISNLVTLQEQHQDLLMRYFASSPAWRLYPESGGKYATRRWMIDSQWLFSLHGYYSKSDIDQWSERNIPNFQTRLSIGFSNKTWGNIFSESKALKNGESKKLDLRVGNSMHQSSCLIESSPLLLEIFEQASIRERKLTQASIDFLNAELAPLVKSPTHTTLKDILPKGSIVVGKPSFELRKSFQPGIYSSEMRINPGESGMIYLKAFEVTGGEQLSEYSLKQRTSEWAGWSHDPQELFYVNSNFTIYEGDWGKPYAARFEIWFVPDSGEDERKLLQKVFKIEGWQR